MTVSFLCHFCGAPMQALRLRTDATGLMVQTCEDCRPDQFAEGTQPGKDSLKALQNRTEAQQELQVATAKAEAAVECLRVLVQQWRKEMRSGYATPEMQWALRRAEEMIK